MKMRVYKPKILLLSLLFISTVNFSMSAQDARKEYHENYPVNKGVTLDAETRYSNVEIVTWERNEVDILGVVEVDASSKSKEEEGGLPIMSTPGRPMRSPYWCYLFC